jgi:hypothetical protein
MFRDVGPQFDLEFDDAVELGSLERFGFAERGFKHE